MSKKQKKNYKIKALKQILAIDALINKGLSEKDFITYIHILYYYAVTLLYKPVDEDNKLLKLIKYIELHPVKNALKQNAILLEQNRGGAVEVPHEATTTKFYKANYHSLKKFLKNKTKKDKQHEIKNGGQNNG